jgi:beta-glucanase (GH16 family)
MSAPQGYRLVFEDQFEGSALNTDWWAYRGTGPRRAGFNAPSQVKVQDGKLILSAEYLENGEFGPGWYSGMIHLKQRYTRGYFEICCICSEALPKDSFWSAFWLQARNPYNAEISRGGPGGAEIDIFEAFFINGQTSIEQNIHCKGVTGSTSGPNQTDHLRVGVFAVPNLCSDFNVFGLEWNEEEYIFYINDEIVSRTSYGNGVSEVDEEVILSLEIPGKIGHEKGDVREFIIDYIRIYQKV